MLARVHDALRSIPNGPCDGDGPGDLDAIYSRLAHLEDVLRSTDVVEREWILHDIDTRRRWLTANPHGPGTCVGGTQVIHGDYQLTNVLFDGVAISAVVDWDRARVASPLMEVVRSLDHGLGLDREDTTAFLAGYRSVRSIADDDLAATVEYWTHQQARSLWALEQICIDGNSHVERLVQPFEPFAGRWEAARIT